MQSEILDAVQLDEHEVLRNASFHLFDPAGQSGKNFRPRFLLLLGRMLGSSGRSRQVLSSVTEMMHTASLIHDDVLDDAAIRRGREAVHKAYGNKVAILAGDFLLARASRLLSSLGDARIVELLSTTLEHLTLGEMLQSTSISTLQTYMAKSFYKTASLLSHSAQAIAALSEAAPAQVLLERERLCFALGKHIGLAFQLIDDLLDFTQSSLIFGKPSEGADLRAGLATAPVLFARDELRVRVPELAAAVERRFAEPGDVELAMSCVRSTSALEQTRELAAWHATQCLQCISDLYSISPSRATHSDERLALEVAAIELLKRTK